jgi:hypothetical protein
MRGLILLTLLCLLPHFVLAEVKTAGFVEGLWFDRAEIFADETVRLYVAIRNNTGSDLTGKLEFKDNGKTIGTSDVSALNNRIIESWVDWTPSYGEHTITATLSRVELSAIGTTSKRVEVVEGSTKENIFVDYDTDKDKVGNKIDTDDDNDDIKDEIDIDPLVTNRKVTIAKSEETNEVETSVNTTQTNDDGAQTINNNSTAGLERYLDNNRADSVLTSVTNIITKTKSNLDEYRAKRNTPENKNSEPSKEVITSEQASSSQQSSDLPSTTKNTSSFGEVTRTEVNQGAWLSKIFTAIKNFISNVYTFILFVLSVYLGHPAVVQLTLLILIIFIIFKVAMRLAGRPN